MFAELNLIIDQYNSTDPMDGFAKARVVKIFCNAARNMLVTAGATRPNIFGTEEFQLIIDLLDTEAPDFGIGTEIERAIRLFKRGISMFI